MNHGDTIAAISSAVGQAPRMIVRASGPLVTSICTILAPSCFDLKESLALKCGLTFRGISIPAWCYFFKGPASVTGEDVFELHIPGNPLLARMLLDELIRLGARQAEPGEFTARAYFNGRIDLAEAEGVAATIAAQSDRELAAARRLMAGELARRLRPVLDSLADMLALVEVGIDFSEEDVSFISTDDLHHRLDAADSALASLLADTTRFERLGHEPRIVLVGRPNAGKSTLLNALAGHDRAVTSPQAGTTRDAIWAHARLIRGTVRIVDVAGFDTARDSDEISRAMQSQARRAVAEAEFVVFVRDYCDDQLIPLIAREPDLYVASKSDLSGSSLPNEIAVSAKTGAGMNELRSRLDQLAFGQSSGGDSLALNARHVQAIEEARQSILRARKDASAGLEILASNLRDAMDSLGQVLGNITPDDVLGRIFSSFCIGK